VAGTVAQGGHISTEPRINERIRVPEVRLVGPAGEQVGIVAINDALLLAQEADLDLVEVAPTARPPVCKLMDYGKFKYESALKARESRKNQAQTVIKEIKLRPKIDPHDYGTKKGHVERFLKQGDKVKVTIMFRGREQSRPELGYRLLQRLAGDVDELGFVEAQPKLDGRNMIMVIGPHKRKAEPRPDRVPARASARAAAADGGDEELEVSLTEAAETETPVAQPAPVAAAAQAAPTAPEIPQPVFIRRATPPPAAARPASAPASSRPSSAPTSARPTTSRPSSAPARPAPAARPPASPAPSGPPAAPRPAAQPGAAPRPAPRPGPSAPRPVPGAPRPAAPRPGPPRPTAPRPAPAAPRPPAAAPSGDRDGADAQTGR
jgi:translation initiation factor IF-3